MPFSSLRFDLSASVLAAASYCVNWGSGWGSGLVTGLRSFCAASVADRVVRAVLNEKEKESSGPLIKGLFAAVTEEALYSSILLSTLKGPCYIVRIARLATALVTGKTAVEALVGRKNETQHAIGTGIGLVWAVAREALLTTLPTPCALPLLAADSAVFALAEVCPKEGEESKWNKSLVCKALSAAFFRASANLSFARAGWVAPFVQHILFNLSRTLPDRSTQTVKFFRHQRTSLA